MKVISTPSKVLFLALSIGSAYFISIHQAEAKEISQKSKSEDTSEGQWKRTRGAIKQFWGEFTDDEVEKYKGNREELVGRIQQKYGETKDAINKKIDAFIEKKD